MIRSSVFSVLAAPGLIHGPSCRAANVDRPVGISRHCGRIRSDFYPFRQFNHPSKGPRPNHLPPRLLPLLHR